MKTGVIIYQGKTKSGKDLLVRYISKEDTQGLLNFINKISAEKTFISLQGKQYTLEEEQKYVDGRIKKIEENKAVHLLAFVDNKLAGGSDIEIKDEVKSHQGLFGITLDQNFRGDGIGQMLMEQIIKESKKNLKGLKIIDLEVFGNNKVAQNLYKKMGFKQYGILPNGIKHKGKFVNQILMYKKIR